MPVRSLAFNISFDTDRAMGGLTRVNNKADTLTGKMKNAGKALERNKERLAGFAAAGAFGLGATVKAAADFNQKMVRASSLASATAKEQENMRQAALRAGIETAKTAEASAEAMGILSQRGFEAKESIKALTPVLQGSSANQVQMGTSAAVTANAMNALNISADETNRVMDVLTKTANTSGAEFNSLAGAYKEVGSQARSVGMGLEETAAIIGTLGDVGIKGSKAGTALKNMLADLNKEAKNGTIALNGTSIKVANAQGNFLGMNKILRQMQGALEGLGSQARSQALGEVFGREAIVSVNTLLQKGTSQLTEYQQELLNSGGYAERVAKDQLDTLSGSLQRLRGSLNVASIKFGNQLAPAINVASKGLIKLTNWFIGLPDVVQEGIVTVAGLGVALTGLGAAVGFLYGPISTLFNTAVGKWITSMVAAKLQTAKMGAMLLWARTKALASFAWSLIKRGAQSTYTFAASLVKSGIPALGSFATSLYATAASALPAVGAALVSAATATWGFTSALLANPITWVVAGVAALTYGLYKLATNWDFVKEKFGQFMKFISPGIKKVKSLIGGAWGWVKKRISQLWNWITGLWPKEGLFGFLIPDNFNLGKKLGGLIQNSLTALPNWLQGPAKKIISFIGPNSHEAKANQADAARGHDQQVVNRTQRKIQKNQTRNQTEFKMGDMIIEGSENPEETAKVVRKEIRKELERAGVAAGIR